MQRFAMGIEFCGMHYRGWQTQQPGVASVQETIEKVLSKVADQPISLHGAGRTDAGVHATNMVAHFDTDACVRCPKRLYPKNCLMIEIDLQL